MQAQSHDERPILVWGLGKTGTATARYLAHQGIPFEIVDTRPLEKHSPEVQQWVQEGTRGHLGGEQPSDWSSYSLLLLSPGVPYDLPVLEEARSQGLQTLASMAWSAAQVSTPIVAVTGSAGKSTTVSLIGHMLKCSGFRTFVGGNLGTPLVSLLDSGEEVDRIVLECSSFQLEATPALQPQVAVLTNLQPNHLDRHGTLEQYAACKARLFQSLREESWIVLKEGDDSSRPVVQGSAGRRWYFGEKSSSTPRISWDNSGMTLVSESGEKEQYDLNLFGLPGHHNLENLAAAVVAARLMGASPEGVQEAIQTFRALPHRLEMVGEVEGVRFFNDSKATTPDSTQKALEALSGLQRPLRLMLGGYPKGGGFASLREIAKETVAKCYFFGQACEELERDLGTLLHSSHPTMEEAFSAAQNDAQPGDMVLLSPACASYDQFANFEERGRRFQELVQHVSPSE